jgi:hypothetical protein
MTLHDFVVRLEEGGTVYRCSGQRRKLWYTRAISKEEASSQSATMQSYDELVELARICLKQAREAKIPSVSAELRHLAKGYQIRAASMDNGNLPDIGEEEE